MAMQKSVIYELLEHMEFLLEKSFSIIPNYLVVVKVKEMESLIDRICQNLPAEIQEARGLLRRKDDFQLQAQQEAQRIVVDAQQEADKLLSESEVVRNLERKCEKYKEQVMLECDEIRKRALNDAENIRIQALEEANKLKDKIEIYCERTLAELEHSLMETHKEVKQGQIYLEKLRTENAANINALYPQKSADEENAEGGEFVIE